MIDDMFYPGLWLRIGFSIICGSLIGFERQHRGKPVDIRTSIMICVGTMLYVYLAIFMVEGREVARVLGQVVTGVGFLGAGAIFNRRDAVTGMTSASVVWLLAGIGAAIGFEYYGTAIAITIVALVVLIGVEKAEDVVKDIVSKKTNSQ